MKKIIFILILVASTKIFCGLIDPITKQKVAQAIVAINQAQHKKIDIKIGEIKKDSKQITVSNLPKSSNICRISLVEEPEGTFDWLMIFTKNDELFTYPQSYFKKLKKVQALVKKIIKETELKNLHALDKL